MKLTGDPVGIDALKAQIAQDVEHARRLLGM